MVQVMEFSIIIIDDEQIQDVLLRPRAFMCLIQLLG